MNDIFWETDLWKIELIRPGLIPNTILQASKNKFGFFDKNGRIYMPLAVYYGTDKVNECLPQGTLIEWSDKCIKIFESRLQYNRYIKLYNNMKEDIN
jgi:hypothetical protein